MHPFAAIFEGGLLIAGRGCVSQGISVIWGVSASWVTLLGNLQVSSSLDGSCKATAEPGKAYLLNMS